MGMIKDRNGKDLTKAEEIKKRSQEYTEELYKKDLYDPENQNDVITPLEPDILEQLKTLSNLPVVTQLMKYRSWDSISDI